MTDQTYFEKDTGLSSRLVLPCFVTAGLLLAFQTGMLHLLGRDWICGCGTVRIWQGTLDPVHNSQHLSDPYSLLHMVFGFGLCLWLAAIRPRWDVAHRALLAVASSTIWEIIENLPFVIARFGAEGKAVHYSGDSIVNSLSDTLFVVLGFGLASRLPVPVVLAAAALVEAGVFLSVGDGLIAGTASLLFGI